MAGRRSNYQWGSAPVSAATIWAGTAAGAISFQTLETFVDAMTIRRIIVDFYVAPQAVLDNVRISGRVGIIVAGPREIAVGATAVPEPIANGTSEWLWNRGFAVHSELLSSQGYSDRSLHLHDDVRGMRKVKEGQSLICVINNPGGSPMNSMATIRFLAST